jgi:hypothetical protein
MQLPIIFAPNHQSETLAYENDSCGSSCTYRLDFSFLFKQFRPANRNQIQEPSAEYRSTIQQPGYEFPNDHEQANSERSQIWLFQHYQFGWRMEKQSRG